MYVLVQQYKTMEVHVHVQLLCVLSVPGFWLIKGVEVLTEGGDDALVLVRVLPEDILDHYNGFLDDVRHLRLDEVDQSADAAFCRRLHLDGTPTNGTHRFTDEININLCRVSGTK